MSDQNDAPQQENSAEGQDGLQGAIARFQALPKNGQIAIIAGVGLALLMIFARGGDDAPSAPPAEQVSEAPTAQSSPRVLEEEGEDGTFDPVRASSETLRRGFVTQQTVALTELRNELRQQAEQQRQEFQQRNQELLQLQGRLQETLSTLTDQMRLMEESNARQREEIQRLAEEARRQGLRAGTSGGQQEVNKRRPRQRISQTPLSTGGNPSVGNNQALLQGVLQETTGQTAGIDNSQAQAQNEPKPFIPPLGFIRGTLLNGVDAIASGGETTPALVRLHGVYKTAHNSTVNLEGCFALVEFEGVISTERARGKPSRMTCVYPDRGAVTYDITGYVVDSEDGVEGIPGVFFEGDSGRIALSIAAQFASGVANIVAENQQTTVVDSDGTAQQFLDGSEARASIASGSSTALADLTDYLRERAERVQPFIRIDATRKLHMVLLSGTELRPEGSAWTLLFDADSNQVN